MKQREIHSCRWPFQWCSAFIAKRFIYKLSLSIYIASQNIREIQRMVWKIFELMLCMIGIILVAQMWCANFVTLIQIQPYKMHNIFVFPPNKYSIWRNKIMVATTKSSLGLHISIENVTMNVIQLILCQLLAYEVAPFCIHYTFKSNVLYIGNVIKFNARMCVSVRTQ